MEPEEEEEEEGKEEEEDGGKVPLCIHMEKHSLIDSGKG